MHAATPCDNAPHACRQHALTCTSGVFNMLTTLFVHTRVCAHCKHEHARSMRRCTHSNKIAGPTNACACAMKSQYQCQVPVSSACDMLTSACFQQANQQPSSERVSSPAQSQPQLKRSANTEPQQRTLIRPGRTRAAAPAPRPGWVSAPARSPSAPRIRPGRARAAARALAPRLGAPLLLRPRAPRRAPRQALRPPAGQLRRARPAALTARGPQRGRLREAPPLAREAAGVPPRAPPKRRARPGQPPLQPPAPPRPAARGVLPGAPLRRAQRPQRRRRPARAAPPRCRRARARHVRTAG